MDPAGPTSGSDSIGTLDDAAVQRMRLRNTLTDAVVWDHLASYAVGPPHEPLKLKPRALAQIGDRLVCADRLLHTSSHAITGITITSLSGQTIYSSEDGPAEAMDTPFSLMHPMILALKEWLKKWCIPHPGIQLHAVSGLQESLEDPRALVPTNETLQYQIMPHALKDTGIGISPRLWVGHLGPGHVDIQATVFDLTLLSDNRLTDLAPGVPRFPLGPPRLFRIDELPPRLHPTGSTPSGLLALETEWILAHQQYTNFDLTTLAYWRAAALFRIMYRFKLVGIGSARRSGEEGIHFLAADRETPQGHPAWEVDRMHRDLQLHTERYAGVPMPFCNNHAVWLLRTGTAAIMLTPPSHPHQAPGELTRSHAIIVGPEGTLGSIKEEVVWAIETFAIAIEENTSLPRDGGHTLGLVWDAAWLLTKGFRQAKLSRQRLDDAHPLDWTVHGKKFWDDVEFEIFRAMEHAFPDWEEWYPFDQGIPKGIASSGLRGDALNWVIGYPPSLIKRKWEGSVALHTATLVVEQCLEALTEFSALSCACTLHAAELRPLSAAMARQVWELW